VVVVVVKKKEVQVQKGPYTIQGTPNYTEGAPDVKQHVDNAEVMWEEKLQDEGVVVIVVVKR